MSNVNAPAKVDSLAVIDAVTEASAGEGMHLLGTELHGELTEARAAIAELIEAVELDAVDKAIASGLGVSEWRAFLSPREAAALARVGGAS